MSSRCKACNIPLLEHEIIWDEDTQTHEELCKGCLRIIHKLEEEEDLSSIVRDSGLPVIDKDDD